MKTKRIVAATAIAAATITAPGLALAPTAKSARTGGNATVLAREGTALFKARGTPWYLSSGSAHTTVTCTQETNVSYYCTNGVRQSGSASQQPYMMFFVQVSKGFATWNLISSASNASGNGGGGTTWSSTVVAMTNAP
jgi:hypothetical protein